jgi:hypothetical protein
MDVSELNTPKFNIALELMHDGKSLAFDGIDFWIDPSGVLRVSVNSSWQIANITDETALNDLERANNVLSYLNRESSEFAQLTRDHPPSFCLSSDYGTGVIELARIVDGKLVWGKGSGQVSCEVEDSDDTNSLGPC